MMSSSSGHQKPSVAQTCNLLSQFLKGNGSFGMTSAANLEANKAVAINLLPSLENNSAKGGSKQINDKIKATDFFQDIPNFASTNFINDSMENGTSQMTIFYNGKVLVFNDFPAEKAKEIMALANKFGSSDDTSTAAAADKINSSRAVTPDLNMASNSENNNFNNNNIATPDRFCQHSQARRASLHRFLAKRKDRAPARAPYQLNNHSSSAAMAAPLNKSAEDQSKYSWLDELQGQSLKQLDLNL